MLHPDFEEIWNYAQNKKFLNTNVITNGFVLNYEKTKRYLKNPKAKIIISLDGFPKINNYYRDPRQYESVTRWLPDILKEFPFQVVIITCLYEDSAKGAIKFSQHLASLGLKFHDFSPMRKQGAALSQSNDDFLSLKQMKIFQKKLSGIKDKFPDFRPLITCAQIHEDKFQDLQNFPIPLFNETYRNTIIRITTKGDVLISTRIRFGENAKKEDCLGNIFEKSLNEIWLSTKEIRKKQVKIFYENVPSFLGWQNNL